MNALRCVPTLTERPFTRSQQAHLDALRTADVLEEGQIIALKAAMNKDDRFAAAALALLDRNICAGAQPRVTPRQAAKGLVWLRNQMQTPAGRARRHNPFSVLQEHAISVALAHGEYHFTLESFENVSRGFQPYYVPVYKFAVRGIAPFAYYMDGGTIRFAQ